MDLGSIPVSAIGAKHFSNDAALTAIVAGGDDYELCFTAPRAARARIDAIARELLVPCTPIGTIEAGSGLTIHDERGQPLGALPAAYDHFR